MDITTLENWLWEAACSNRNPTLMVAEPTGNLTDRQDVHLAHVKQDAD